MNKKINGFLALSCVMIACYFSSCRRDVYLQPDNVTKPDIEFYGLSSNNMLIRYNAKTLGTPLSKTAISGLAPGEKILAIDFRPATGQLYGLGAGNRLYIIQLPACNAVAVGNAAFTPALSGDLTGFDFNPTVDRIRVVTSSGQNLRLHPETGLVAATDANLNPGNYTIGAAAYTNNQAGASTTELYDLDLGTGKLLKQMPPNDGVLVEVGSLDVMTNAASDAGFDIAPENRVALATFMNDGYQALHQIDLNTGKATFLGYPLETLIGIAIPTQPVAYATDMMNNLQIFNFMQPAIPVSKTISGLQPGETILGMDMRPATGQLYALGSSSRLYILNMATGAASMVGMQPFSTPLSGTSFGFDFNPTVDKIRVVSNTGQNMRLNPVDGSVTAVDGALPGNTMPSSAAYTQNFFGAVSTTLYDIDPLSDRLYKQSPPNDGILLEVGKLGVDIINDSGFDIGGMSGKAYALLPTIGGVKVYMIDLTSGVASPLADYPNAVSGFAIGLGF